MARLIRLSHPPVSLDDLRASSEMFETGILTKGPVVARFEAACAARIGVRHAIATSSGTTALHLVLLGMDLGVGAEVVTPDFSFPASANAVVHAGGTPVLADIELATYNLDPADLARRVTSRTRAIMVVHQFGSPAPMDAVLEIAKRHGVPVIEDAACALGATWRGRPCGAWGRAACFSFHPRKVITTAEGGLIVTDDDALAARCRVLRDHGLDDTPEGRAFVAPGYNFRMSEIHAALGLAQLAHLDDWIQRRRALAGLYTAVLARDARVVTPATLPGATAVYQSYVVSLDPAVHRDGVLNALRASGVEAVPGNWAIHTQPYYRKTFGYSPGDIPRSLHASRHTLALPLHPGMADDDVTIVVDALRRALA